MIPTGRSQAGRSSAACLAALVGILALGQVGPVPSAQARAPSAQDATRTWLGPDLQPLPLTEDEILDALRTGDILEREWIDIGINGIDLLLIEKNGVRMRAGFRIVDINERDRRVGDESYLLFRDDYRAECAAYELARLLDIPNVPPTTLRTIRGIDGSIQLWVEDLFDDSSEARSPDYFGWALQISTMIFFDALVYNTDRNPGNVQVDHAYKLWMIDHTRAFQNKSSPFQVERVNNIRHDLWDRFRSLRREDYERIFAGLLEPVQVEFFMDRRAQLIEHIERLIAERGPEAVLFEPRQPARPSPLSGAQPARAPSTAAPSSIDRSGLPAARLLNETFQAIKLFDRHRRGGVVQ
jgi:hypothetical protein